ncbi:MFS transporter [Brevibacillus sp. SYSU BS000544]|uniref:MFS transporter n=1 Tax=Brevibacillus sp. SYSU BS000544 TaxID=3416443 RepID=UPI003CE4B92A
MASILVWCGLVVVSSLYITIPMAPIFSNVFGVSQSQASWTTSAFSFAYAVGFLLFAPLSEKYGRKQMMLAGLIALFVVSPILGVVKSLPFLVILRSVQGLAASTFAPAVLAYVVEMFPIEKRVTTLGFVSTGFLMAGIVGQVFSSLVSQSLGWSYVFTFLGGIYLLSAVLLARLVLKGEIQQNRGNLLAPFKQMGTLLLQKNLFFCYFITITLLFSFVGMYTALGDYLSQSPFGLNNHQILMVRASGIIGMLLSPFAGGLVAKFGIRIVLQANLILATVGMGLIGIISNLPLLVAMSVIFVVGISLSVPTLISMIGNLGGKSRGVAVSLYTFILFIGATLGPVVALNLLKTGSYILTFEVFAAFLCIGFFSSFLIKMNDK